MVLVWFWWMGLELSYTSYSSKMLYYTLVVSVMAMLFTQRLILPSDKSLRGRLFCFPVSRSYCSCGICLYNRAREKVKFNRVFNCCIFFCVILTFLISCIAKWHSEKYVVEHVADDLSDSYANLVVNYDYIL